MRSEEWGWNWWGQNPTYKVSSGCLSSLQPTYSWSCDVLISSPLLPAANGNGVFNASVKELWGKDVLHATVEFTPPPRRRPCNFSC